MSNRAHEYWMARALKLAARGRYTTSPNPNVGCVIVADGELVGAGYHQQAGTAHAEVHALADAGDRARGAIAYVTLEPCSHHGKTPPCAEALIRAGVDTVVCAMTDPNPQVAGQGLQRLKDAGINVLTGVLEAGAEAANRGFLKRMRTARPFVVVKMASSLDGGTALASGESQWITGPQAREDVQRGRAESCAVVTGVDTVIADDPSLNVRLPETDRQPVRVILDTHGRTPADARIATLPGRTIVVHGDHCTEQVLAPLRAQGFELVALPLKKQRIDLSAFVDWCGAQAFNRLWIEAGATLAGAFMTESLIDEIWLYQAPVLLGTGTLPVLNSRLTGLDQAVSLTVQDVRFVGNDIRWQLIPAFP